MLSGCDVQLVEGRLSVLRGADFAGPSPSVTPKDPQLELPLGEHAIEWLMRSADGAEATLGRAVSIEHVVGETCCPGGLDLELGTEAADALVVDGGGVCALMEGGDDFVRASADRDFAWGAAGNDYLSGGEGGDTLLGGEGDDYLSAAGDHVELYGGPGRDVLHASHAASATLFPGAGADQVVGSPGPDVIEVGADTAWVLAEAGDDSVVVLDVCELHAGLHLDGGAGKDTLTLPIDLDEAEALGVSIDSFEQIHIDASRAYLADCFEAEGP